jgi:hypothetical protein
VTGCAGPNLAPGNRCTTPGPTVAAGGQPLIDDFEPVAGDTPTCHRIREVDGRSGAWNSGKDGASPNGSVVHSFEPPGAGAAPGSTRALHVVGQGLNGYGGFVAVPLAPCYNASRYEGISFWFKGDPAKVPSVKVSFVTPGSALAAEGGRCIQPPADPPGQLQCYDHFSVNLFKVSNIWTRYAITWQQLAQFGWGQNSPRTYVPQTEIIGINFAPTWGDADVMTPNKAFDFWIDDLSFDVAGSYADTGFRSIVTAAQFNAAFSARIPFYANAYNDIAAALNEPRFSRIFREGSADDRKREIAAFMAHVWQESGGDMGGLTQINELPNTNADYPLYCLATDPVYPCAAGQQYFGRGPLQLTWNYNYGQASEYLGLGTSLLTNPAQLVQNSVMAWRAAMFYWMAWKDPRNALLVGPHNRFMKEGFGGSLRAINGGIECPVGNVNAGRRRAQYQVYCGTLGVTGCDQQLACPAM